MKRPGGEKGATLGVVAPALNQYTQTVLYEDLWERPGLSQRDRSMVTIAALIAMHRPDQMINHMQTGMDNGITRKELGEMITHLAFYASWPNARVAAQKLRDLAAKQDGDKPGG